MTSYISYAELRSAIQKRTGLEVLSEQWITAGERCRIKFGHRAPAGYSTVPLFTLTLARHVPKPLHANWRIVSLEAATIADLQG